jgi:hypothetical protein
MVGGSITAASSLGFSVPKITAGDATRAEAADLANVM